jgi:aminopeptidase N
VANAPRNRTELDPYRLPRHVVPRRYDIRLEPNLTEAAFEGRVVIEADTVEATRLIVLNARELDIQSVHIDGVPAVHALDVESERLIAAPITTTMAWNT